MFFPKYAVGLLLVLADLAVATNSCDNIVDVACGIDYFSTLCAALGLTELVEPLSEGHWTVFAPTNQAFENLGDLLDVALNDIPLLADILLFHAVDEVVEKEDLECTGLVEMANHQNSRTICKGEHGKDGIFQKGGSNPRNNAPEIVATDIPTCQGVIHIVDEVLLPGRLKVSAPPPPSHDCESITDIACGTPEFSTLCSALIMSGLAYTLEDDDSLFTVFAPTNEAFSNLGSTLNAVLGDVHLLKDILLFHVVVGEEIFEEDLGCTHLIEKANGKDSRTVCRGSKIFQKGKGNPRTNLPEIIQTDIGACNGIIHVVDEVLLF